MRGHYGLWWITLERVPVHVCTCACVTVYVRACVRVCFSVLVLVMEVEEGEEEEKEQEEGIVIGSCSVAQVGSESKAFLFSLLSAGAVGLYHSY